MGKIPVQPPRTQKAACDFVDVPPRHARCRSFGNEFVRFQHVGVDPFEIFVTAVVAEEKRTRTVGTVPFRFAAEIYEYGIPERERRVPRFVMRNAAVRAECDDRLKRSARGAAPAHFVFEQRRDRGFRHPLFDLRQQREKRIFGYLARLPDQRDLLGRFDLHRLFERGHAIAKFEPLLPQFFRAGKIGERIRNADFPVRFQLRKRFAVRPFFHANRATPQRSFRRLEIARIGVKRAALRRDDYEPVRRIEPRKVSAEKILFQKESIRACRGVYFAQSFRQHNFIIPNMPNQVNIFTAIFQPRSEAAPLSRKIRAAS